MSSRDTTSDILGFFLGFFFGCLGIVVAGLMFRGEYLRGAVVGMLARIGLAVGLTLYTVATPVDEVPLREAPLQDVPWELVGMFVVVVVLFTGLVVGAFWAFGPRGGGGDDDPPAPPPARDVDYVTFGRGG